MRTLLRVAVVIALTVAGVSSVRGGDGAAAATPAITVGEELLLMTDGPGKNLRFNPAVAFGRDVYLAVWQEGWSGQGGKARIHAARVSRDGKMLDAKAFEVSPAQAGVQEQPRVAFAGGTFLVVWHDSRGGKGNEVLGARVSPEGKLLDASPLPIGAGPRSQVLPDVAGDDKGFMVVWQGFVAAADDTTCRTFAARVGLDGKVARRAEVRVMSNPRIAWNGAEFLIVSPSGFVVRTDAEGKALSAVRVVPAAKVGSVSVCGIPSRGWAVAADRTIPDFWGWGGPGAQRVYSIGVDGKAAAIVPSENYNQLKAVPANWFDTSMKKKGLWPYGTNSLAWDGRHVVAAWQRYRVGGATGIALVNGDIISGRIDGWKPLDGDGIAVADSPADERNPALAGDGAGNALCVYEKKLDDGCIHIAARTVRSR